MSNRALILVDIQNDFLPGGALAVPEGDHIIPIVNQLVPKFDFIIVTQDWHPPDHCSFAVNHKGGEIGEVVEVAGLPQVLWPVHCVAGTHGAELSKALHLPSKCYTVKKGAQAYIDSYSAFFDNGHRHQTELEGLLRNNQIDSLYFAGLATDYCVKFSALDAVDLGFNTNVIVDGCRAVNLQPGDEARALDKMEQAGVHLIRSEEVGD
jgi:nicotinamidase/pyrazinamidase